MRSRFIYVLGTLGLALDVASAVCLRLFHRPLMAGLVIGITSILVYMLSLHAYQKRSQLRNRMVQGLLKCNEYICGPSSDGDDEESAAVSRAPLLTTPASSDNPGA